MKSLQLALFGDPVSHSLSPGIYEAFGRQFEIEIDYRLIQANAEEFPEAFDRFRSGGGNGCNITLPLKHEACKLAAVRSPAARLAEAANTLWWDSDGQIHADNTDGVGMVRDIDYNLGFSMRDKRLVILGAGGATAGVLGALISQDPTQIRIANRTPERAFKLAERYAGSGDVRGVSMDDLAGTEADMVIDATSVGHRGGTPAVPESLLTGARICYSLNYGPAAQPMSDLCRKLGVPFQSGLGMLIEQAARAFQIWTGLTPQTESVYKDLDYAMRQTGS